MKIVFRELHCYRKYKDLMYSPRCVWLSERGPFLGDEADHHLSGPCEGYLEFLKQTCKLLTIQMSRKAIR